jgi:putative aldouronate transport system substrate-binding protein
MTVGFAPETPEFKVALEEAAKWWERGYIDTNFFNKSASKSARENYWVNTNKGGLTHDYITGTYTYIEGLNAMSEGANLTTLAPISGQLGTTDAALFVLGGQAITTKAQDTLACLKFLDYLWSEEGQLLTNWGYEGETFEYNQNGDPVLINGWTKDTLREIGVRNPDISGVSNNDIEYEGGMPQNVKDSMEYNKRYLRIISDCDWFRVEAQNYVTSMDATELQTNLSNIRSALDAYIQGVIMGQKNLTSDYDAFMAQVNGLKLAETKAGCENAFRNLCESYGITTDRLQ